MKKAGGKDEWKKGTGSKMIRTKRLQTVVERVLIQNETEFHPWLLRVGSKDLMGKN